MTALWHFYLAAKQAFANWRSVRHINLADAWSRTALDALERMRQ